ncbi:unnamed protein product [Effrenium voratum]|nr:unnamed protein product [Effrenium voratum]
MGAPAQLALLREVVGGGPTDDVLSSAWRRSGGDLAAAVNLILDAPGRPSSTTILLDDTDGEDANRDASDAAPAPQEAAAAAAPASARQSGGQGSFLKMMKVKQELPSERPKKKPRNSSSKLETPPKVQGTQNRTRCNVEWAMALGSLQLEGYSNTKLSGDQQFPGEDGSFGPLLRAGARLELKWTVDKKSKPRPGTVQVSSETGTVRFDANGREVGKFPSWASKALVPLLARKLIDAEAVVGPDPPRALTLGTNVPVVLRVSLRSSALRTPGQMVQNVHTAKGEDIKDTRNKGQKTVQKAEADREVQRNATSILLERLRLPCRRRAVEEGDPNEEPGPAAASLAAPGVEEAEEEDQMSKAAAAQLGKSDQLERHDLPGIVLPDGIFETRLRPYQAQAVYWMWQRENPTSTLPSRFKNSTPNTAPEGSQTSTPSKASGMASESSDSERQLHPMWDEYELPEATGPLPGGRESARFLYYHRTTGALSLDFPDAALAHCRGGILADDMGLGKTVMCLALTALDYGPASLPTARTAAPELRALEEADVSTKQKAVFQSQSGQTDDGVAGVLVVAPMSLIRQWHSEAEKHFHASAVPSVHEFHGSGKNLSLEQLRTCGLVLTTYNTLSCQPEDSPLFQLYWRRIILDEAHAIKNRCSRQAQAAFRLRGFCRWCVTGTPLQNSVEELYSAVHFLRIEPWCAWSCWRKSVALPLEKGRKGDSEAMNQALDAAKRIVTPLIIRRTKSTVDPRTGEPLLVLPTKHVHVRRLELSLAERDFYDTLWTKAKTQFDTFVASGEVLSKYTHILQLILKLRQALCHPFLVFAREATKDEDLDSLEKRYLQDIGGDGVSETFVSGLLQEIRKGELSDCAICFDAPEDPTLTHCGHIFCRECCFKIIKQCGGECPVCRQPGITKKNLKVLPGASRFPAQLMAKASSAGDAGDYGAHSTKMKELLGLLREDMAQGQRAVVYSQWTSFLDLLAGALEGAGIRHKKFDGSLSLEERAARVAWLGEEAEGAAAARVLLVSLKAGGTGLNLVAASRLYLMDLWWNPAVEEQAIQRVHRIGQKQEVYIYKFVVEDTIDLDLLELHKAKERLLEDALSGGRHQETSKLTVDDLKRLFNPCRSSLRGLKAGGAEPKVMQVAEAPVQRAATNSVPDEVMQAAEMPVQTAAANPVPDEVMQAAEAPVQSAAPNSVPDEVMQAAEMPVQTAAKQLSLDEDQMHDVATAGLLPAWEAAGDLLPGPGPGPSFFDEDDISDGELLAACHAAEVNMEVDNPAASAAPACEAAPTACWEALPLDM